MSTSLEEYDFYLPEELIGDKFKGKNDESRLLVYKNGNIIDTQFSQIFNYLNKGDMLILNDTKVIKSYIKLKNKISLNLHTDLGGSEWICYCKNAKKVKVKDVFYFDENYLTIEEKLVSGEVKVRFNLNCSLEEFLQKYGHIPIPQYIEKRRKLSSDKSDYEDEVNYQTVYSKNLGSIAAPTAGLHFTKDLLDRLEQKGVLIRYVTLHVGIGTYKPIKVSNIENHAMHQESAFVSRSVMDEILLKSGKVCVVGSTSLRAIESSLNLNIENIDPISKKTKDGFIEHFRTDIYIKPGYKFRLVDMVVTNFHLPKSSLLVLVSALIGLDSMKLIYKHAIESKYRFYSYGDCSLLFIN